MDKETGKIAAMSLIQVSEVDKSNEMEKKGFIKALQIIKDKYHPFPPKLYRVPSKTAIFQSAFIS